LNQNAKIGGISKFLNYVRITAGNQRKLYSEVNDKEPFNPPRDEVEGRASVTGLVVVWYHAMLYKGHEYVDKTCNARETSQDLTCKPIS
jgi:hypothetical protein